MRNYLHTFNKYSIWPTSSVENKNITVPTVYQRSTPLGSMTNKICTSQMSNIDFPIMLERADVGTGETHTVPYNLFLRLNNKWILGSSSKVVSCIERKQLA